MALGAAGSSPVTHPTPQDGARRLTGSQPVSRVRVARAAAAESATESAAPAVSPVVTKLHEKAPVSAQGSAHNPVNRKPADPALARLADLWPTLPPAVRAALLALAESSGRSKKE